MIGKIKRGLKHYSFKELLELLAERYGFGMLERIFFCNWFNPFATLWLNMRSFPINQAVRFPVWCYGRPRFYGLAGRMQVEGRIMSGMIRLNQVKSGAPSNMSVQSEILNQGLIIFRGSGFIGTGVKIVVGGNAILDVGRNFKIADMCNIGCFCKIRIGEQSRIAHRCQIFDSSYHYIANFSCGVVPNHSHPIHIGKGCWICNTSTLTGGTILPDYTIVGSNSLVNKNFSNIPNSSMIGGIPAKLIATGFRRVEDRRIEWDIARYYKLNPDGVFNIPSSVTPEECSCLN